MARISHQAIRRPECVVAVMDSAQRTVNSSLTLSPPWRGGAGMNRSGGASAGLLPQTRQGLRGNELEVGFVAKSTGLANRKVPFVNLTGEHRGCVSKPGASLSSEGFEMAGGTRILGRGFDCSRGDPLRPRLSGPWTPHSLELRWIRWGDTSGREASSTAWRHRLKGGLGLQDSNRTRLQVTLGKGFNLTNELATDPAAPRR